MDLFNANEIHVSPFLICPTAYTNQETSLIFGSSWVREEKDKLLSNIFTLSSGHFCKIVAIVFKHKNRLIVAQIVYTKIKDRRTNREGLCFIYGGVIEIDVFLEYNNVCQSLFEELHNFIVTQCKTNDALNGMFEMINLFQQSQPHEHLINKELLGELIQEMESKFYLRKKKRFIDSVKARLKGFGISTEVKPCRTIEQANEFWKQLDNNLSKIKMEEIK